MVSLLARIMIPLLVLAWSPLQPAVAAPGSIGVFDSTEGGFLRWFDAANSYAESLELIERVEFRYDIVFPPSMTDAEFYSLSDRVVNRPDHPVNDKLRIERGLRETGVEQHAVRFFVLDHRSWRYSVDALNHRDGIERYDYGAARGQRYDLVDASLSRRRAPETGGLEPSFEQFWRLNAVIRSFGEFPYDPETVSIESIDVLDGESGRVSATAILRYTETGVVVRNKYHYLPEFRTWVPHSRDYIDFPIDPKQAGTGMRYAEFRIDPILERVAAHRVATTGANGNVVWEATWAEPERHDLSQMRAIVGPLEPGDRDPVRGCQQRDGYSGQRNDLQDVQ